MEYDLRRDEDYSESDDIMEEDRDDGTDIIHPIESYPDYQQSILYVRNFDSIGGRGIPRPKTRRRRWTQRDMTNAYNAVKCEGMSLRGAATAFNVPESTLRDRVHGRVSLECSRPGPPTFFTNEEEKKMVDHILFMSKIGYPYTRNQVVELAGDMTKAVGRIAPFKYLNPSQAWFYAFLNRWPDLKYYLFGPRSNRKSKGVSGDSIQSYFEQLEQVITKCDIKDKPAHFWIVDEVSISCENQPPKILPISIQRAQSVSYWNPTVAMLGAANGLGEKVPPFLIYRGESISSTMMQGSVRGTKFSYSATGWVNSDAFIQWFLKHFRQLVRVRPLVLFYDGHLQFVSVRVLERAREDNVFLFPLPPHPAYNHCVENTCFWAFQMYFKRRLERFFEQNPNQPLVRTNAAPVLTHAYERALQPTYMVQLFERLGICPFNNISNSIGAYLNMPDEYDQSGSTGEYYDHSMPCENVSGQNSYNRMPYSNVTQPITLANGDIREHMYNTEPSGQHISPSNASQTYLSSVDCSQACSKLSVIPSSVQGATGSPLDLTTKPSTTVVTPIHSSGRSFTIQLHGPAAGALRPIGRPRTIVPQFSVTNVAPMNHNPATKLDSTVTNQLEAEVINHEQDVDVSHEEEIGYDGPQLPFTSATSMIGVHDFPDEASTLDYMDEMEEGETSDICVVCGQLEPPESACQPTLDSENADDLQVVDWVHCDYCNRWVHWNGSCSKDAVVADNSYMCVVCRNAGVSIGNVEAEREAFVCPTPVPSMDHIITKPLGS